MRKSKNTMERVKITNPITAVFGAISKWFYNIRVAIYNAFNRNKGVKLNKKNRAHLRQTLFLTAMLIYPVLHFCVFYIGVNANSVILAFQKYEEGSFVFNGFANFSKFLGDMFSNDVVIRSTINSLLLYASGLIIGLPLNIIFSYFIYKKVPLHGIFKVVLFMPSIISSMIMSMIFKLFLDHGMPAIASWFGFKNFPNLLMNSNTAFGTIIFYSLWTGFATGLILYLSAMSRIPESIIEYGRLEGVGMFKEMWLVVVPLIFPTITTLLVTGVVGLFTNMGPVYAMFGDSANYDMYTLGYYLFVTVIGRESTLASYPYASAAGLIFTVVAAPITLLIKFLLEKFGPTTEL